MQGSDVFDKVFVVRGRALSAICAFCVLLEQAALYNMCVSTSLLNISQEAAGLWFIFAWPPSKAALLCIYLYCYQGRLTLIP